MARHNKLPKIYTNFWNAACWPSILLNVFCTASMACMGRKNIMPTIMMGKIEIELPAIHIMNMFIGTCLIGPNAISHDLLTMRFGSTSLVLSTTPAVSVTQPTGPVRTSLCARCKE